jgi:outer membrane protein assembly factor BamD
MIDSALRGRRLDRSAAREANSVRGLWLVWVAAALAVLLAGTACAGKKEIVPTDPALADQFLFRRGNEELAKKHWVDAREYFRQIVENYPGSSFRAEAKLGLGDAYLGEKSSESLVLAANEYREFLTFYPTNPKADYAQYKLAMTSFEQMRAPDRDQTPTREALNEFDTFFTRYPNSPLTDEVRAKWRMARDQLSDSSFGVGLFYFKNRWYPGAIDHFREIIKEDPGFSGLDRVYFYLAESLARTDKKAEAIPLFDRLVSEYKASEHHDKAQKRLEELKAQYLG